PHSSLASDCGSLFRDKSKITEKLSAEDHWKKEMLIARRNQDEGGQVYSLLNLALLQSKALGFGHLRRRKIKKALLNLELLSLDREVKNQGWSQELKVKLLNFFGLSQWNQKKVFGVRPQSVLNQRAKVAQA